MPFGRFLLPFVITLFLALGPGALAQTLGGRELVKARLVADTTAVVPGQPFTAGLLLEIAKGWHTYWQFSGDAGAPVRIDWELPEGYTAAPIQWPIPHLRMDEGDLLSNVYEDEVLLLVTITPPAATTTPEVQLKATVRWLVCEKTCIPGQGEVALTLPIGVDPQPANAELFAKYRALLPKSGGAPFEVQWERTAEAVTLRIAGLPKEFGVEFFPIPPSPDVKPDHPKVGEVAPDGSRTITVPISEGGAPDQQWQGVLVTSKGDAPREGWAVSSEAAAPSQIVDASPPAGSVTAGTPNLLAILWGAFLGGLILNLMPCVLPVIALKIFGFVQQAGSEPRKVFRLGLAFVAGVFAFFLGIAVLAISLRASGGGLTWGFQFQNVYLLTGLIALVFVFALSMFGIFEIQLGGETTTQLDALARRDGYGGAFMHGMFTTLLGTSCTAPFLGPVLGFAFVQPAPSVFAIFTAIAAGMSLPYFLLTWKPAWMRFLPRPGAWMERLKQFMGFLLLAVVVWLLGVLGQSRGTDALAAVLSFLLALGLASWMLGSFRRSVATWLLIAAVLTASWFVFVQEKLTTGTKVETELKQAGGIPWEVFTPQRVEEAVRKGQPVFIDFTAEWCLNCKYNEKAVLETDKVRAAIAEKGVLPLKGDWTNADPVITEWLKKFGRIGVPVYVLYTPGKKEPFVFPEILTQAMVLERLSGI